MKVSKGRLRLRLPRQIYGGKQKYLTLGLTDTPENRKEAEKRSRTIELDIVSDNFDPTLNKYRPSHLMLVEPSKLPVSISLDDIWQQFCEVKKPTVALW